MSRFSAGDDAAFRLLFQRYRDRVYRLVLRAYCSGPAEAEDCTQETFLKVIANRDRFDASRTFTTWLYAIARHHCLNVVRARGRRPEFVTDLDDDMTASPTGDAAAQLAATELDDAIREAVARLPEPLREVFVLREVEGMAHADIAHLLHLEVGAVRTRLHRAKQRLQSLLRPYLEDTHGR
jgi:RNA polymerase sigma-70 factor (ECF subfamily)